MNANTQLIIHSSHLLIRAGLNTLLAGEGDLRVVAQTEDTRELLNRASQLRPQVLLLGVAEGDCPVQPLIRQIKSEAPTTAVLVIAMRHDACIAAACADAGASMYLGVCPEAPQLKSIIRQLVRNRAVPEQPGIPALSPVAMPVAPPADNLPATRESKGHPVGQKPEPQRMLAPLSLAMNKLAKELNYLTAHDPMTGLLNRREFERRLKGAVSDSKATGANHSLLYFDLDQFKVINDTCGHVAGDEYLRQVSELLNQHVRASDTLARLGGDEFALLLYGCGVKPAARIADTLREVITELEFRCGHRKFRGSVSIGVVTFAEDALNAEQVLSVADSACFLAKEKGRNRIHVYRPDDDELSVRREEMDWVSRLREALEQRRLTLYAQDIVPIVPHADDRMRLEVLVRLKEADGKIIPPIAFIPAAERYNLMPAVDRYVISAAFRHLAGLDVQQRRSCCYSINLSGATLNDEEFPAFVEQQLTEHGLSASQVCFEITETAAISNLLRVAEIMRTLKGQGFQFALDDFGRGMSSLAYLKHLPVDFIKIDGEFIKNILTEKVDNAMVRAIASIAKTLGIQTVAEFVENDAVVKLLNELGVDFAQGYGIHKPEPLENRLPSRSTLLVVSGKKH